jgi:hypothetical protein
VVECGTQIAPRALFNQLADFRQQQLCGGRHARAW